MLNQQLRFTQRIKDFNIEQFIFHFYIEQRKAISSGLARKMTLAVTNVRNSILSSSHLSLRRLSFHRPVSGRLTAIHVFNVQPSEDISMYAQFEYRLSTDTVNERGPLHCTALLMSSGKRLSKNPSKWAQRCSAPTYGTTLIPKRITM